MRSEGPLRTPLNLPPLVPPPRIHGMPAQAVGKASRGKVTPLNPPASGGRVTPRQVGMQVLVALVALILNMSESGF